MGKMKEVAFYGEELLARALERHSADLARLNARYGEPLLDPTENLRFLAMTGAMVASVSREGAYGSYEELALENGHLGRWSPISPLELMPAKNCYANALTLALEKGYTYVEGYAHSILTVAHAWCEDERGNVVEPTWDADEGRFYLGVPMDPHRALAHCAKTGYYGLFCNDWITDLELLRGGYKELIA